MDAERQPATPDQLRELEAVAGQCAAIWARQPDARCFAALRVRSGARVRDLILGDRTLVDAKAALIDWERAPLAAVFLANSVGDEYELELGFDPDERRTIEGTVLARALIESRDRMLWALDDGEVRLYREASGGPASADPSEDPSADLWWAEPSRLGEGGTVPLRPLSQRSQLSSPIEVVLDPVQRAAVELPGDRSLLVLGEAGFGKTTVALHRVAELHRRVAAAKATHARAAEHPSQAERERGGPSFRALVLVPTPGLRRLLVALLERLGIRDGVEVRTFHRWIAREARRVFPDLPARDSETAPVAVARVKRHPGLRALLPEIIRGTAAMREVEAGYAEDEVRATRDQLLHLFGDRALLERLQTAPTPAAPTAAELRPAPVTARMIAQVLAHTRVQFTATTERALAHVDADRLATVDGLAIDAGTPLHDAETVDVEDFAVLFELHRLRTGTDATEHAALTRYDHIVVDEAQEFAPIELAVIGRALAPDGSITVAGDEHQQVDETIAFTSWPEVLAELGVSDRCERVVLRESYRCPPTIEAFARTLFGLAQPVAAEDPVSADPALIQTATAHELELVSRVIAALTDIRARDRLASVAVVCRFASSAQRVHGLLNRGVDCRLVVDGDFRFGPGISVTCVDEVKGLEFDYVIVPDASAANYPNTGEARRALYVAATRALARLWLLWNGRPSPLLLPPGG